MEGSESEKPKTVIEKLTPGRKWPDWHRELAAFRHSNSGKAVFQLINTLLPYCLLWYLMVRSIQLGYPYALTLLLAPCRRRFPCPDFHIVS